MDEGHTTKQAKPALKLPFGALSVAGAGAIALATLAFVIPREWIESIAFQLYADKLFPTAVPPFGVVARLVTALLLALLGASLGLLLARLFGVTATDGSLDGLLARVRGQQIKDDDEDDAPWLRAADRHPDAPARRPLSAARDIPAPRDDAELAVAHIDEQFSDYQAPVLDTEPFAQPAHVLDADEDQDELILDTHYWAEEEAVPEVSGDDAIEAPVDLTEPDFDLPAPTLADWEVAEEEAAEDDQASAEVLQDNAAPVVGVAANDASVEAPLDHPVQTAPKPAVARAPLDLSVARLDDLLARLEAGLAARDAGKGGKPAAQHPDTAEDASAVSSDAGAAVETADDPAFPQDPALAAALATLRRLNQQAS